MSTRWRGITCRFYCVFDAAPIANGDGLHGRPLATRFIVKPFIVKSRLLAEQIKVWFIADRIHGSPVAWPALGTRTVSRAIRPALAASRGPTPLIAFRAHDENGRARALVVPAPCPHWV